MIVMAIWMRYSNKFGDIDMTKLCNCQKIRQKFWCFGNVIYYWCSPSGHENAL